MNEETEVRDWHWAKPWLSTHLWWLGVAVCGWQAHRLVPFASCVCTCVFLYTKFVRYKHQAPYMDVQATTVISDGSSRTQGYSLMSSLGAPPPSFLDLCWEFPSIFISVALSKMIKLLSRIFTYKAEWKSATVVQLETGPEPLPLSALSHSCHPLKTSGCFCRAAGLPGTEAKTVGCVDCWEVGVSSTHLFTLSWSVFQKKTFNNDF